jgi:hypothetical protein
MLSRQSFGTRSGFVAVALVLATRGFASCQEATGTQTEAVRAVIEQISAPSLRGHLSFLASDLLEGRDTPSRGLDLAAEYIAAQFRRAGLEPVSDGGYFQVADWRVSATPTTGFRLELRNGDGDGETIRIPAARVSFPYEGPIQVNGARVIRAEVSELDRLKPEDVRGAAVFVELPDPRRAAPPDRAAAIRAQRAAVDRLTELEAALVVSVDAAGSEGTGAGFRRLIDPERQGQGEGRRGPFRSPGPPRLVVHDPKLAERLAGLPTGPSTWTATLELEAPVETPAPVRNVAGLLRGSDQALNDTYVIVSAHYDHVGLGTPVGGDRIYNGANDDGSGTVSVIEIASALARLPEGARPKRSVLFLCFFGEEKGLLGSRYYGRHPLVPLEKTVAQINLEQVGRTDDSEGPRLKAASMTGFDFSSVGETFAEVGKQVGVEVQKHPQNSDAFFGRSDNQALADLGIPAHTLCTAFMFPEYHAAGDHWEKVDYENMALVDRMIAVGVLAIANDPEPPRWNEANPRTKRYVAARKKLLGEE